MYQYTGPLLEATDQQLSATTIFLWRGTGTRPGVMLIGLQIARTALEGRFQLPRRQHRVQGGSDGLGNLALDVEEIVRRQRPVVGFAPSWRVCSGVDQLDTNAHPVAGALHRTLKYCSDTEFLGNIRDVLRRIGVAQHRGARDHAHRRNLGKPRQPTSDRALSGPRYLLETHATLLCRTLFAALGADDHLHLRAIRLW